MDQSFQINSALLNSCLLFRQRTSGEVENICLMYDILLISVEISNNITVTKEDMNQRNLNYTWCNDNLFCIKCE